jgi:hypothetical protein
MLADVPEFNNPRWITTAIAVMYFLTPIFGSTS